MIFRMKSAAHHPAARRLVGAGVMVLLYLAVQLIPRPPAIQPEGWRLLGIFVATIAGMILGPLPGGALVLIAITLVSLWGGLTIQQALAGYGDPTVWLVLAAFFISRGLIKTGLARRIALFFVRLFGKSSLGVCYALSLSDMVLASIIPSNAARSGGVILPIVRSVAELYGSLPGATASLLGSFLMTSVYQNICVTAAMFYTGQASNPLAAQIASQQFGYRVTWIGWLSAGIVPGLCSLALLPLLIYRLNPPDIKETPKAAAFAKQELQEMGRMKRGEKIVLVAFLLVCGLWITTSFHHIDITVTALLGSSTLLATGVLNWEDVKNEKVAWDIFIWYGGLLRLGKALNDGGITHEFARTVSSAFSGAGWLSLLVVALLIYFYAHYAFASITAHMLAMFTPFVGVLAAKGGPVGLIVFAFACFANLSAGLTHYGTTPTPMYFAQGYVSMKKWWMIGALASFVNLAVWSVIGFGWWKLIGVW
ncbi:MAG TPA: DASS family sodium-coupled anion symporter [Terriglobia bacterium]|nr:DASS family sodium-coupled anion symporter [Terriglobia bacterium]